MARLGTKNNPTKEDFIIRPEIPVNKKYTAEEWNYLSDKCQNPGVDQAFSAAIRADDFYTQADFTQSGALAFTKHGSVTSAGKGNGAMGKFTCDGSAVTFSADFEVNYPASFDNTSEYIYFFVWNGTKFQGFVRIVGADAAGGGGGARADFYVVDFDNGNDTTGDGSPTAPYATLQKAANERETDAATYAVIRAIGNANPSSIILDSVGLFTILDFSECRVTGLTATLTDCSVSFFNCESLNLTVNQTAGNSLQVFLYGSRISDLVTDTINNSALVNIYARAASSVNMSGSTSENFDCNITGENSSYVEIQGSVGTIRNITIDEGSVIRVAVSCTIQTLSITDSVARLGSGTVTVSTAFTFINSDMTGRESLTLSGTINVTSRNKLPHIWYVDERIGDSDFDGSQEWPFASIQSAVTARQADANTYGEIIVLDEQTDVIVILASAPGETTKIKGTGRHTGSRINLLTATDTHVILEDIRVLQTTLSQTGSNGAEITLINADAANIGGSTADETFKIWYLYGNSKMSVTSGSPDLGLISVVTPGGEINLGGTNPTMYQFTASANCTMKVTAPVDVTTTVTFDHGGTLIVEDTLTITTDFNHDGLLIDDVSGEIVVSGTETFTPGRFAHVKLSLTQAQIQALNTTPITILAAPGANKGYIIKAAWAVNNYNTAAFATATTLQLKDGTSGNIRAASTTSFIQSGTKRSEQMSLSNPVNISINTALTVTANANATSGNAASTFDVFVEYIVVNV